MTRPPESFSMDSTCMPALMEMETRQPLAMTEIPATWYGSRQGLGIVGYVPERAN